MPKIAYVESKFQPWKIRMVEQTNAIILQAAVDRWDEVVNFLNLDDEER